MDKKLRHQQNVRRLPFRLVVLDIHPNDLTNQVACVPMIEEIFLTAEPGRVYVVEGPHSKRDRN